MVTRSMLVRCAVLAAVATLVAACSPDHTGSPAPADSAASRSAVNTEPVSASTTTSPQPNTISATSQPVPICAGAPGLEIQAPLAEYGDRDSATLDLPAGTRHAGVLCGTFTIDDGQSQQGSATLTPGHLAYLFSLTSEFKANGVGGGYYWIAGAVDDTVASVVLSFPDRPAPISVELVRLTAGWRGFADEYSPHPAMSMSAIDPTVTVIARGEDGATVDARHINLRTGAVSLANPAPIPSTHTDAEPTRSTAGTDLSACGTVVSHVAPAVYLHSSLTYPPGVTPPPDPLDTQTFYIGGQSPGLGMLCHGSTRSGPPALSATAPVAGAVPYLAEDQNGFWGAVGPGVTRLDLTIAGDPNGFSFTVGNPDVTLQLRDLGDGWHAFNTDTGISPAGQPTTATAYDATGQILGNRTINKP